MMSYKRLPFSALSALLLLAFASCKKDHRILGNEVLPQSDVLDANSGTDFPVYAHSRPYDSIVSVNTDGKFLGVNDDGSTGKLEVGLCLNANLVVTNVDFGATAELISADLVLAVSPTNFLGNKNSVLSLSMRLIR